MSRTSDVAEYYVAGRRVPALFNGMATGADWMSAASFIGMAGGLYLPGFDGLAFIMGWTGGYCLVALLLAPYLRKFGQFTIPDFLGARYGGDMPRARSASSRAILCSFTYVVAQIYGVGLITARFTGVEFELGIFLGLGGILVCSFLGGMRAVTWTQVAQYIILIIAYMIPVVWLSVKHTGVPVPQIVYGKVLEKVTGARSELTKDPKELEVRDIFKRAPTTANARLEGLPDSRGTEGKAAAAKQVEELKAANASASPTMTAAENALAAYPKTAADAPRQRGPRRPRPARSGAAAAAACRAVPGQATRRRERRVAKRNFLALVFCLMVGTAALPHILMRYYTTPSVQAGARVGVLVAVLHLPAVLHGAGAGGAGEVRHLHDPRRQRVRRAAGVGGVVGEGRPEPAVDQSTSTGTASCSSPKSRSAATSWCWPRRRSPACPT